jgi:hypothetical protein
MSAGGEIHHDFYPLSSGRPGSPWLILARGGGRYLQGGSVPSQS